MILINLDRMRILTSDLMLYSRNSFISSDYISVLDMSSFNLQKLIFVLTSDTVRCLFTFLYPKSDFFYGASLI
ncbi:hypothetical protein Cyast_2772 [Cyanobacterium stanieri PCC 7202]|uniref:Uncharacterized protein n=1 Tax=Cyanobacterium stanieri (strain ATCC 29140 / PCC 7202) TaxID=292563 RepID=K9YPC7_CYASC|nr:hypothetical protein Cyast_2772 [Cyanobacterium stanieri PCC 7202]